MNKYFLGCDGGTGGMRVGVYDLSGNELAFAVTEYQTYYEHPGWAEQNPLDWWNAFASSTKKAIHDAGISKKDIVALSYDATCGSVLLCQKDGTPIGNSLIWMDVRASKEAREIGRLEHPAKRINGSGNISAEWMPCKALWLKRNRPEDYEKADVFCEYSDWLTFKLTDRWTSNLSSIAARWYYDGNNGGYPVDFYTAIGIADLLPKLPDDIHSLGDCLGKISPKAAEFLGLSKDVIIGQGGVDASVGLFGLGVVNPGQFALITGSSHLILGLTDRYRYGKGYFGPFPDAIRLGYGLVEGGQTSSGSIVKWFKDAFCKDLDFCEKDAYAVLNKEAEAVPIGSEGLLVLDWWQGNRNPYTDPDVRGTIYGLSLKHTRAHVFRAIMESVAFGTENILNCFRDAGFKVSELSMCGGATNSPLWMQIHADVSNIPINIPLNTQSPALGSAILASIASGVYSLDEAVQKMVHNKKQVLPIMENHIRYEELFSHYASAYSELSDWMHKTTRSTETK